MEALTIHFLTINFPAQSLFLSFSCHPSSCHFQCRTSALTAGALLPSLFSMQEITAKAIRSGTHSVEMRTKSPRLGGYKVLSATVGSHFGAESLCLRCVASSGGRSSPGLGESTLLARHRVWNRVRFPSRIRPALRARAARPRATSDRAAKARPLSRSNPEKRCSFAISKGAGTIRHIWITTAREPQAQRACVIRAWWDGQEHPSFECPIGDLFGFAHGKITSYNPPYIPAAQRAAAICGCRCRLPNARALRLPTKARSGSLYYQITYTLGTSTRRTWAACTFFPSGEPDG